MRPMYQESAESTLTFGKILEHFPLRTARCRTMSFMVLGITNETFLIYNSLKQKRKHINNQTLL